MKHTRDPSGVQVIIINNCFICYSCGLKAIREVVGETTIVKSYLSLFWLHFQSLSIRQAE
ncbi:MAG TPA: hypothetical protein VGH64_15625 [Puia sp.]